MGEKESGLGQRLNHLLDELPQGSSRLALKCRDDPKFYHWLLRVVGDLRGFYQMDDDALRNFTTRLHGWITAPPESYIGFVGELQVADWLRQRAASHRFMRETERPPRTPDIELTLDNRNIYLEIRTMRENHYQQFAERVAEELAPISPGCSVTPKQVTVKEGREKDLVAVAVRKIQSLLPDNLYNPIEYQGEEGDFSLVFYPGTGSGIRQLPIIAFWPEARDWQNREGEYVHIPWLDCALVQVLREKKGQFETYRPTFLVWVSYDALLPDFKPSVSRVLEQYGREFDCVAGVIVLHPALVWDLTENLLYSAYKELRHTGLFDAVGILGKLHSSDGAVSRLAHRAT
jgi:hypothetical protein